MKIFNCRTCISTRYSRCFASICGRTFKIAAFCRQNDQHLVPRFGQRQLSDPVWQQHPRGYSTANKTLCDVHKFGELHLTAGSSCDVTVLSLDPELYLDQNLVIVDDIAQRLSVSCQSADGISRVSLSESKDVQTGKHSGLQCDGCTVQVPIKFGTVYLLKHLFQILLNRFLQVGIILAKVLSRLYFRIGF